MQKYLTILLLLIFSTASYAQRPGHQRPNREQIKAARIAFLTNRLQLDSEQAKEFWPIFNEYEAEKTELSKKYNQQKRDLVGADGFRNMSDENAAKMLDIYFDQKEAELKVERKYVSRFREVLNPRQTWAMVRFESDFRRTVIDRIRKQGDKGEPGSKRKTDDGN